MRCTADLEVTFEAAGDEQAGASLISLVRLLNALQLAEEQEVESYLLSRGDVRVQIDVTAAEFKGRPRHAELHVLPRIRKETTDGEEDES